MSRPIQFKVVLSIWYLILLASSDPILACESEGFLLDNAPPDLYKIETNLGQVLECQIDSIDRDGWIKGPGVPDSLNLADLLTIETSHPQGPALLSNLSTARLTGGGIIRFDTIQFDGQKFLMTNGWGSHSFEADGLRAVLWRDGPIVQQALATPQTDKDQLVVDNDGEIVVLQGILETMGPEKIQFNFEGKSRSISSSKVLAVTLAQLTEPSRSPIVTTAFLTDGSTIRAPLEGWSGTEMVFRIGTSPLSIQTKFCAKLEIHSDRVQFLSTVEPIASEISPIMAPKRFWKNNLSVEGNEMKLRVDGTVKSFRHGIGTATFSKLTYSNDSDFNLLLGVVGIDEETSGRGICRVAIRGDGVPLFNGELRGGQDALEINVNVSGYQKIELVAEPGAQLDLADHVDWANLRFLNSK